MTTNDEVEALRQQVATQQAQLVALMFEGAIKEGRIQPASREQFRRRHGEKGTVQEAVQWIETSPRPAERFARHGSPSTFGTDAGFPADGPDGRLVALTKQRIQQHLELTQGRERLDFGVAAAHVARELNGSNPDLLRAWLTQPGEV